MLITWGKKGFDVGAATDYCEKCDRECTHYVFLEYGVFGVFWIFNFCNEKRYYLRCSKCGVESPGDAATIKRRFPHAVIPTTDRYGCVIFIVAFVLIVCAFTCFSGGR